LYVIEKRVCVAKNSRVDEAMSEVGLSLFTPGVKYEVAMSSFPS